MRSRMRSCASRIAAKVRRSGDGVASMRAILTDRACYSALQSAHCFIHRLCCPSGALLATRDQLSDLWHELRRDAHHRLDRRLESGLVFGDSLYLRLRLIVFEHSLDPVLVPAGRKFNWL